MSTLRPIGEIQHSDDDATYYCGLEYADTHESFGVYQYVTFVDPGTGKLMVGKPHSFWYCKHELEYQAEIQPFPYTRREERLANVGSPLIELDTQTATIEIPASSIRNRIRTNVVYVPSTIPDDGVEEFVRKAPPEYTDKELSVCCDDEEDPKDEEEEDEDFLEDDVSEPPIFFYRYARVPGKGRRKKRVLATPPKFVDGWMSFCGQAFGPSKPYWEHEFASFVLDNYLRPLFERLSPSQDVSQTFYAIETRSYSLVNGAHKVDTGERVRKKRGKSVKWFPKSDPKSISDAQIETLRTIETFLGDLMEMKEEHADYMVVFQRCLSIQTN